MPDHLPEPEQVEEREIFLCGCDLPFELEGPDGGEFDLHDEDGAIRCPECEQPYKPVPHVPLSALQSQRQLTEEAKAKLRDKDRLIADLHARLGE